MKRVMQAIVLTFLGLLVFVPATHVAASVDVDASVGFYDALSPYGDWIDHPRFGLVWAPRDIERGWRPYTYGHWEYTDDDWTWVSDEDWGWITCHYGRWLVDPDEGWIWIPGDEWAPAWVVWREGDGYIGWAPMPPEMDAFNIDVDVTLDPFAFSFVEERYLCEPRVYAHYAPVARNTYYLGVTRSATRYLRRDGRIINRGIDVRDIERLRGRPVPRLALRDVSSPREARGARANRGWLPVYRPRAAIGQIQEWHAARAQRGEVPRETRARGSERQQEQERRRFEAGERRERERLRSIQQRESAHPERAIRQEEQARAAVERRQREESQARAATERDQREQSQARAAAEQRQQRELQVRAEAERRQQDESRGRAAEQRRQQVERQQAAREQLHQRHEAERQAQAQHEQRERQTFQRRQERERQHEQRDNGQQKKDDERHRH